MCTVSVVWGGLPAHLFPLGDGRHRCLIFSVTRRARGTAGAVFLADPLVCSGVPTHLFPLVNVPVSLTVSALRRARSVTGALVRGGFLGSSGGSS